MTVISGLSTCGQSLACCACARVTHEWSGVSPSHIAGGVSTVSQELI